MLRLRSIVFTLLFGLLLFSLVGCSNPFTGTPSSAQSNSNRGDGNVLGSNPTASPTSQPLSQTVTMPSTDTSCPASGTARAAVMRPLALGSHQNLVYDYRDASLSDHLRRYDMTTGQKVDILTSQESLNFPQISSDGQWLLFMSSTTSRDGFPSVLQLVRMDGQGLQTLYCLPGSIYVGAGSPIFATLSPDMRSVAITYDSEDNGGTIVIQLLDIVTGQLQTVLTLPGDQGSITDLNWLDNTHIYATRTEKSNGKITTELVLLDVTARTGFQPVRDFTPTGQMNGDSYACTPDGTKLFVASYQASASSALSALTVGSSTSSASSVIYKFDANTWARQVRAVSNHSLLLRVDVATTSGTVSQQIWTMNADGTGQKVLTTISSQPGSLYSFASFASFNRVLGPTWFDVSRDGNLYALDSGNQDHSAILVGPISGGKTETIVDASTSVMTIGWTTM